MEGHPGVALAINLGVAAGIAGLRMRGWRSTAFQAAAHLYVGGLAGAWACCRQPWCAYLLICLAVVETGALVAAAKRKRVRG